MLARQLVPSVRRVASRQFASLQATALSLEEPFPGVPETETVAVSGPVTVENTTLPNGVRVVSADMAGHTASIRLLIDAGSRCETLETAGASQLLAHAAFQGTSSRSATRFAMDIEELGGKFSASAGREQLVYVADVLKGDVASAVAMLGETALDGKFTEWHLEELREGAFGVEMGDMLSQSSVVLSEALHEAAFRDNSPLGQPCYSDGAQLTASALDTFVSTYHGANAIVLAGAGMPHATLVDAANAALGHAVASPGSSATSAFHGGERRLRAGGATATTTHISLGFEGAAAGDAQAAATYGVLATVLELAGPGQAFNAVYKDTGMFGLYGCTDAPDLLLSNMVATLQSVAKGVDQQQLKRAIAGLVASTSGSDGARAATATELAARAARGVACAPTDVSAAARSVSSADVSAAAAKALASKPALASLGNLSAMPYLDDIKFA